MASIGFAFDIYVLLVHAADRPPALAELLPNVDPDTASGTSSHLDWTACMFWVRGLVGGIFGLLGGYLTDLLRPAARPDLEHPALRRLPPFASGLRHVG